MFITATVKCDHCTNDIPLDTIIVITVNNKSLSCCAVCAVILTK